MYILKEESPLFFKCCYENFTVSHSMVHLLKKLLNLKKRKNMHFEINKLKKSVLNYHYQIICYNPSHI